MTQILKHHFHRNILKGAVQCIGNAVGQSDKNQVENPGSPHIHLNTINRTGLKVRQFQLAFSDVESIFILQLLAASAALHLHLHKLTE